MEKVKKTQKIRKKTFESIAQIKSFLKVARYEAQVTASLKGARASMQDVKRRAEALRAAAAPLCI